MQLDLVSSISRAIAA